MRPRPKKAVIVATAVLLAVSVGILAAGVGADEPDATTVLLVDPDGAEVGTVRFIPVDGAVRVRVRVHDLPPGFHGFHIHETGACSPPSFASAGGHLNPAGVAHDDHAGDMPALLVNADGTGEARFKTDRFEVADLLDPHGSAGGPGSAVIVHALADNHANIPIGTEASQYTANSPEASALTDETDNAGERIACGAVPPEVPGD